MSAVPEPSNEVGRPIAPVWLGQRERGSRPLMAVLAWVTLTLGRAFGRLFLPPIALYFVAFGPRARAASADYLGRVFGRPARLGEIYRHFHTFASTIHDRVLLLADRADVFDVTVHGEQPFDAALAEGRGCVLLGAHVGSFEVLRSVGATRRGLRVRMVMATGNAMRIQSVFGRIQPESADWIIPMGTPTALLRARESLERGEVVGILADRVWRRERATACRFSAPRRASRLARSASPRRSARQSCSASGCTAAGTATTCTSSGSTGRATPRPRCSSATSRGSSTTAASRRTTGSTSTTSGATA